MDASATPSTALDLDPSLYHLDPDELEFFKVQTGIQDEEELKEHIIAIQAEAWKVRMVYINISLDKSRT